MTLSLIWVPNQDLLKIVPWPSVSGDITSFTEMISMRRQRLRLWTSYCLSSVGLLKPSGVLGRLNEEMPKAATPTGPVIKDNCGNLLQSSVAGSIRAISGLVFKEGKQGAVHSSLQC